MVQLVESSLAAEGVECARYGEEVDLARALHREEFGAIVFDASAGLDPSHPVLARRACYGDRRAPLVAIGDFCARDDMHAALSAGADDFVLMPVDPRELRLRVLLAARRFSTRGVAADLARDEDDELETGVYRFSRRDGRVHIDGRAVHLTAREFAIAWVLFSQQGSYVTRRALAAAVWGSSEEIAGRTLEQHIYKLRKKLALDGAHGVVLRTMYAHGYRIERVLQEPVKLSARVPANLSPNLSPNVPASVPAPSPVTARAEERGKEPACVATPGVATPGAPTPRTPTPATGHASTPPRVERELTRASCLNAAGTIKLHASSSETARNAQPWPPQNEACDAWPALVAHTPRRRSA
ncbi:response regulator transcription factor [Paraburkholderia acidisoli]|uniref:response regulator transcription factor n=1 Tax=Paraburkholderia acidisoli TaxID=2571748 RepID=UPI0018EF011C|nr:response regulator transcription factor [Paraburkholderia acidisoli]